jgi:hypothetical protein
MAAKKKAKKSSTKTKRPKGKKLGDMGPRQ